MYGLESGSTVTITLRMLDSRHFFPVFTGLQTTKLKGQRGVRPRSDAFWLLSEARTLIFLLDFCGSAAELAVDMARLYVRHNGTKSPFWSPWLPLVPQSDLFKGIWPPHTRRSGPLVGTPGVRRHGTAHPSTCGRYVRGPAVCWCKTYIHV